MRTCEEKCPREQVRAEGIEHKLPHTMEYYLALEGLGLWHMLQHGQTMETFH